MCTEEIRGIFLQEVLGSKVEEVVQMSWYSDGKSELWECVVWTCYFYVFWDIVGHVGTLTKTQ